MHVALAVEVLAAAQRADLDSARGLVAPALGGDRARDAALRAGELAGAAVDGGGKGEPAGAALRAQPHQAGMPVVTAR